MKAEWNYGQVAEQTDGQMYDPITRCLWWIFHAGGIESTN